MMGISDRPTKNNSVSFVKYVSCLESKRRIKQVIFCFYVYLVLVKSLNAECMHSVPLFKIVKLKMLSFKLHNRTLPTIKMVGVSIFYIQSLIKVCY